MTINSLDMSLQYNAFVVAGLCLTIPAWSESNLQARFDRGGRAEFGSWAMRFSGSVGDVKPVAETDGNGSTRIRYASLYAGVDVVFHTREGSLECVLEVGPEADPESVRFDFGTMPVRVSQDGVLELGGERVLMTMKPPVSRSRLLYYEIGPATTVSLRRSNVTASSALNLTTILGGLGFDASYAIAVDAAGNKYIAGDTDSQTFSGGGRRQSRDGFVAKLDSTGSQLLYLTYFGGSGNESTRALTVDASGNAYIAGTTTSTDFITTPKAVSFRNAGFEDAFALKLNPAGNMVYSTLLGSSGSDQALGIAVDTSGNMYVTGQTAGSFPITTGALQTLLHGATDCFISKLNPNTGSLVYSTLLGGSGFDSCRGIAVDSAGNAYVAGVTYSPDFPVRAEVQSTLKGLADAFITKIDASGAAIVYSTFLGGDNYDEANAIAVDSTGSAYVAGDTTSWNFPVSSFAAQTSAGGGYDAFVARLSPPGGGLIYSTLIGGGDYDSATAISLDGSGHAAIGGFTSSVNLPVRQFVQGSLTGATDAFAAVIDAYGSSLLFCTYLGGSGDDRIFGIAAAPGNHVYAAGMTQSSDFPGATAQTAGNTNIFIAHWSGSWQDPPLKISVSPSAVTLTPNQSQQFSATAITGVNPGVTWSISPNVGTIDAQGLYRAPFSVTGSQSVTVTATSISGGASSSALVSLRPPTTQFIQQDSATQGSWKTKGYEGFNVIGNVASYPAYVTVTPSGNSSYVWAANTSDVRALQQVSGTQRIAGVWYTNSQFTVDMVFNDSQVHQLAIYCLDWDNLGRSETIDILDGNGTVFDTRNLSNFGGGVWLSWNVSSHVQLRVKNLTSTNAVMSGLFFGPMVVLPVTVSVAPKTVQLTPGQTQSFAATVSNAGNSAVTWSISPNFGTIDSAGLYTAPATITGQQTVTVTATSQADSTAQGTAMLTIAAAGTGTSAQFLKLDAATQGSWKGVYGTDGYNVINNAVSYPAYVNPTTSGASSHTWASTTSDMRALQQASGSQRVAGVWYTVDRMVVDIPLTDGQAHQLAVYFLDWDNAGRSETVEILNSSGNVLDTRTITGFVNGVWAVWNIAGHVQLRVTRTVGLNAVMTGLFFGPAVKVNPVQFVKTDTTTQGSWKGIYGANGYNLINSVVAYPSYVTVTPSGNSSYTWAATTSDVRAPQQPSSSQRTAGVWYATDRFTIDLAFTDALTHQVAVYSLDWDYVGRTQTLEILDAAGTVLDTRPISSFSNGVWLVWNVAGHVQLRVTRTGFGNGVISAILFDPPTE